MPTSFPRQKSRQYTLTAAQVIEVAKSYFSDYPKIVAEIPRVLQTSNDYLTNHSRKKAFVPLILFKQKTPVAPKFYNRADLMLWLKELAKFYGVAQQ